MYPPDMEQKPEKILIVDDDPGIRDLCSRYLSEQGYEVSVAADGREMDEKLAADRADLLILDVMLPGEDGLSIARRLQTSVGLPVIMLSARGEDMDRIIGLEVGADDYLAKPFNPRELLARIRAVLRRRQTPAVSNAVVGEGDDEIHLFGEFRLDTAARIFHRGDVEIPLTTGEFDLLHVFVEHPDRALSRDRLVDLIKGYDRSPFDRSIDVRVTRLRQKIEDDPKAPRYIHTIWGVGYMFTPKGKSS